MGSEPETGSLLATLAASKPGGEFLELGTGTGLGTAWILAGMDVASRLATVENNPKVMAVARNHLAVDPRVTFCLEDGAGFLERVEDQRFDFIFADTWPGKYTHLEEALRLLKLGGLYIVDDLIPLPNWPPEHGPKVPRLIARLEARSDLRVTQLHWATGLIIATRISGNET